MSRIKLILITILALPLLLLAACGAEPDDLAQEIETDPDEEPDDPDIEEDPADPADPGEEPEVIRAGFVSAIDQVGPATALDLGIFEDHGLEVELADPFPTGVEALTALEAGDVHFIQAGIPTIGAINGGMDVVYLATMTGVATQTRIDEIMAMVAAEEAGIDPDDLTTLEGQRIGVSIGSVNHLYLLGLLDDAGLSPDDVEMVNTPPPDMPVAISTGDLDAVVVWDPWPVITLRDADNAVEIVRGGGYISMLGYIVAMRDFVNAHPDLAERFVAARAEADQWMRQTPEEAAEIAVRWLPGTEPEVADEAMQHTIRQMDPRFSVCSYLQMELSQQLLLEVGAIEEKFDVNQPFEPEAILSVMEQNPEYFDDLESIPEGAEIDPDFQFDPDQVEEYREICG